MTIDTVSDPVKDIIYVCGTYGHCTTLPGGGTYCSDGFFVSAFGPAGQYEPQFRQTGTWSGFTIPGHTSGQDYFTSVHVVGPNSIILTGVTLASTYAYIAMKVNSAGVIDTTFGNHGLWEFPDTLYSFNRFSFSRRLGPDKLVLCHSSHYEIDSTYITYLCIDTSGQTVPSFGINGHIEQSMNLWKYTGSFLQWFPMSIDSLNRIYTCLYSRPSGSYWVHILRMLPDGSRDPSFGKNGMFITEPIAHDSCVNGNVMYDALVTHDNRLVMAFWKDYNILAMSYGGGIYRYVEAPAVTTGIPEAGNRELFLDFVNGEIVIRAVETGVYALSVYAAGGQVIHRVTRHLHAGEVYHERLPGTTDGLCLIEVHNDRHQAVMKIWAGK